MSNPDNTNRPLSELASACRIQQAPKRYRIRNISEEGECHYCGYLLLAQEEAYEYRDEVYCSRHCAMADQSG